MSTQGLGQLVWPHMGLVGSVTTQDLGFWARMCFGLDLLDHTGQEWLNAFGEAGDIIMVRDLVLLCWEEPEGGCLCAQCVC
jgi:hypothetical protein